MTTTMRDILNPGSNEPDAEFPNAPSDWTRATAEATAGNEGLALGADHWATIQALQSYFARNERPNMRELQDALEERFHASGGLRYLYALFPGGPIAQGCRLAGIEPPAGAVDKSFGSVR
ncbi:TusE/DsrC/DsvC family sulfur relay protein [Thioalkalicoccus limnaeus]|uniref:TusE/DsrC/DsvC family sulfur relay protein n=1 Tax=Thioalkalicoccus limnaeus TaxID=120681 RepID=A0ABV4BC98_9GAMM